MGKEGFEPSTPRFGDACSYSTELQARPHIYYQLNLITPVQPKIVIGVSGSQIKDETFSLLAGYEYLLPESTLR